MIWKWRINPEYTFTRIEFWIILFFIVRLVGITNAPLEIAHNWRQVTGLMVARNFFEIDSNIFFPRIDETQGATGIIGMEFPLLNYLHYSLALIFDYQDWYGRLINLIVSSIGILYFYRTVRGLFSEKLAFYASYILLISSWFAFSRKMMPDTFCVSLMFIALYHGLKYLKDGRIWGLILYFIFVTLAVLSKLPAGIYLSIFIPYFIYKKPARALTIFLTLCTLISLIISWLWYFYWCHYLSDTYGQWYNSGMDLSTGFGELYNNLGATFKRFYFDAFSAFSSFIFFLLGAIILIKKAEKFLISVVVSISFTFMLYMLKAGYFFHHHSYYILPFVPVMSLVIGYLMIQSDKKRIISLALLLMTIEGVLNQQHDFFIKDSEKYKLTTASYLDTIIPANNKIVINGNGNPQLLYFSHRKGWICNDNQTNDKSYLDDLRKKGCDFLVLVKKDTISKNSFLKKLSENKNFIVYAL